MSDDLTGRLITAGVVLVVAVVVWLAGRVLRRRLPERWGDLVAQLVPVLVAAVVVVGALVVADPNQADQLLQSLIQSVPKVMVAVIVLIIARALGRIVGLFVETALRGVSPVLAGRARLLTSALITGVGVVIAMQQLGVSADIILILVAALAFGTAVAAALGVGLGSVPLARQVAAGRHVAARYTPGERVRIGDISGTLVEIGLVSSRIEVEIGKAVDVPNAEFIEATISVEP
jgi:small-conductance mechanosensitive channel